MLKAKVLAMCVCPTLAVPPAVIAVHAPARHAVAHLLHRAAHRLDRAEPVPAVAATPAAALPCAPSLAAAGGGGALPVVGGSSIGGTGEAGLILAATGEAASPGLGFSGGDNGYSGGGFGGGGGGGGGGFGSGGGNGVSGGGGISAAAAAAAVSVGAAAPVAAAVSAGAAVSVAAAAVVAAYSFPPVGPRVPALCRLRAPSR